MQFELVLGLKNGLETMFEKEAKMREKEEAKAKENTKIPSMSSMMSSMKSSMPSMPSRPHF